MKKITETWVLTEVYSTDIVGRNKPLNKIISIEVKINYTDNNYLLQNCSEIETNTNCVIAFDALLKKAVRLGNELLINK